VTDVRFPPGAAPSSTSLASGTVVGIYIAQAAGMPMQWCERVELMAGVGIVGDRYATRRGHWSDPRWPDQELTLVEEEIAEELGIAAGNLRRNVVTRGILLTSLIGVTFAIGSVELHGVRPCNPCGYLDGLTRPGVAARLGDRGGLRALILDNGPIRVGDTVIPWCPPSPLV
jgi:MOSC domain-containing protein YiiM